jgi:hypothetical protein
MSDVTIIFTNSPMESAHATLVMLMEQGKGATILRGSEVLDEVIGSPEEEHVIINVEKSGGTNEACEICDWSRYDPGFLSVSPPGDTGFWH